MKLATVKNHTRDGQLLVVSKDLKLAVAVSEIAVTMQQALDNWAVCKPKLEKIYTLLNQQQIKNTVDFNELNLAAPLPRAYQWAVGSAYINHVELVRKARNSEVPESFYTDPLMYQGGSDDFIGPCDDVVVPSEAMGIDFEAERS